VRASEFIIRGSLGRFGLEGRAAPQWLAARGGVALGAGAGAAAAALVTVAVATGSAAA
jgi:hypothetical protein